MAKEIRSGKAPGGKLAQSICREYWLGRGRYSKRVTKRRVKEGGIRKLGSQEKGG